MFLLFIFFGALLVLILMAMNENGQLHNPPAEELAKYEAIKAEEDRRRMELDGRNRRYEDDPFFDPLVYFGYYPSGTEIEAGIMKMDWDD
ncbi:hypothetical protein [Thiolapillus sp.]|uniref:hypothetical protein n=1 Tax=Thiolapillus sp. TaxID=2017437 RepID=UPI0025DA7964|nr:hypothetical protein [Thiolapillus sp.]